MVFIRPGTCTQYQQHIRILYDFCINNLRIGWSLPKCITKMLCLFIQAWFNYSTIMTYVSAISFYHRLCDFKDPSNTFYFSKLLQGIKNQSTPAKPLLPLNLCLLKKLLVYLPIICNSKWESIMMKAAFCAYIVVV